MNISRIVLRVSELQIVDNQGRLFVMSRHRVHGFSNSLNTSNHRQSSLSSSKCEWERIHERERAEKTRRAGYYYLLRSRRQMKESQFRLRLCLVNSTAKILNLEICRLDSSIIGSQQVNFVWVLQFLSNCFNLWLYKTEKKFNNNK